MQSSSQSFVELGLQTLEDALVALDLPLPHLQLSLQFAIFLQHLAALLHGLSVGWLPASPFQLCDFLLDAPQILILPAELHDDGFKSIEFLLILAPESAQLLLEMVLVLLEDPLELLDLAFVAILHILEGLDQLFQHVNQAFGLHLSCDLRGHFLLVPGLGLATLLQLLPEAVDLLLLSLDGLRHLRDLLVLLFDIRILVVELLNGLSELGVDLDELLQRLLEQSVLLLQLRDPLPEVHQFVLSGEVVLEIFGHDYKMQRNGCGPVNNNFNNKCRMGQRNSEELKGQGIALDSWVQAIEDPNSTLFNNVNPYRKRLLVNKDTEEVIEEYELQFLSQEDFHSYSREVELRKEDPSPRRIELLSVENEPYRSSPYIYKVKHFTNTSVAELCSTIYNGLLYAKKVDLRLKEINDIPLPDQLYLYQCCLEGFKVLYEQVGYFDITEEMIFFTEEGKVRVWMNPNLSKHHPNYSSAVTSTNVHSIEVQGSQSDMLRNLINVIEDNTDSMADCPIHFREYLIEKGIIDRLSFYRAIDEFHLYVDTYRLTINPYMKSIYELFQHQDGHEGQSQQSNHRPTKKEYDSLKNSSHQLSFQKINSSSHRNTPLRHNHLTPLDASRASKHSYNSEYNSRQLEPQPGRFPPHPKNTYNEFGESSQISITHLPQPQPQPRPNLFSKANEGRRQIVTFCPPERKVFNAEPAIAKYRSLEKHTIISNQPRPITFSYQNQQPIRYQPKQIITSVANPQDQAPKERKESIIDKLKSPPLLNTNTTTSTTHINNNTSKQAAAASKINYFSTSQAFVLDKQIAEDMMKYLGFNPNLI